MDRDMESPMERGLRALLQLTDWACYLVLTTMAVVVTVDVAVRSILGYSTQIAEEVASLGLIALIFLSLPGSFKDNGFLRIDALYSTVGGSLKSLLTYGFHLIAMGVTSVYIFYVGKLTVSSYQNGIHEDSFLATPKYLPQISMLAGLVILLLVIVFKLASLHKAPKEEVQDDL